MSIVAPRTLSIEAASSLRTCSAPSAVIAPSGENIGIDALNASMYSASSSPRNVFGVRSAISCGECACIHASVRVIACASFAVASWLARIHSVVVYRTDAGYVAEPNAALTPAAVRRSASTRTPGFRFATSVNDGSAIMPASTFPCSIAAIAVAALPMAVMLTESGGTPWRCKRYTSSICDDEPAVVTPAARPPHAPTVTRTQRRTEGTEGNTEGERKRRTQRKGRLCKQVGDPHRVFDSDMSSASRNVIRSQDVILLFVRAVVVSSVPLCLCRPLCVLCSLPLCPCHVTSRYRSNHRSNRVTAALTTTTTMPRTVIPAKTPVVSNVPSACEIT